MAFPGQGVSAKVRWCRLLLGCVGSVPEGLMVEMFTVGTSQLAYIGSFSFLWLHSCHVLDTALATLLMFERLSSNAFGIGAVLTS